MIVVVVPFAAFLMDFLTRCLARYEPNLVYVMVGSGAALSFSFAFMVVASIYDMWMSKLRPQSALDSKSSGFFGKRQLLICTF